MESIRVHPIDGNREESISNYRIMKELFHIHILVRRRNKSFVLVYIMSIILAAMYLVLDPGVLTQINAVPSPNVTEYSDSIYDYGSILDPKMYHKSILSPNNNLTRYISERYMFKNNSFAIMDSVPQIAATFDSNQLPGAGFSFIEYETNKSCSIVAISSYSSPEIMVNAASELVMNLESNNTVKFNISSAPFSHPAMNGKFELDALTAAKVFFCFAIVVFRSCLYLYKLGKDKVLFILQINQMPDLIFYFTIAVVGFIELLIPTTVVSLFLCFYTPSTKGANFLLIFMCLALFSLGLWLLCLAIISAIRSDSGMGVLVVLILLFEIGEMVLFLFKNSVPDWVIKLTMIIFPNGGFHGFFNLITKMKSFYGSMGWEHIGISFIFNLKEILIYYLLNITLGLILVFLFVLCSKRFAGKPPLGWRNIFSIAQWKRVFSKKRESTESDLEKPLVSIKEMVKVYEGQDRIVALNNLSINIQRGEIIVLIGPNGSGKSSLINSMTGAIDFDSGEFQLSGKDVSYDFYDLYDYLGFVSQDNVLINDLTVREHIQLFSILNGSPDNIIPQIVDMFADAFNIRHILDNRADGLSGGEKRKLCIAVAMVKSPKLLILDEPTAGVDVQSRQVIWKAIGSFKGTTSLISSHSLEEAEGVSTKIVLINKGEISFSGSPAELREMTNCGYILRVVEGDNSNLLQIIQEVVPEAKHSKDQTDCVIFPVDLRTTKVIEKIEQRKKECNIVHYTLHLESLEDVLIRYVEEREN